MTFTTKIGTELLTIELQEELAPLVWAHHREIGDKDSGEVDVAWGIYTQMQEVKGYEFIVAREDDAVVGYCGFLIMPDLHHQTQILAVCDLLYVVPDFRPGAKVLTAMLEYSEEMLAKRGVNMVVQTVKDAKNFGPFLRHHKYFLTEYNYSKRIG